MASLRWVTIVGLCVLRFELFLQCDAALHESDIATLAYLADLPESNHQTLEPVLLHELHHKHRLVIQLLSYNRVQAAQDAACKPQHALTCDRFDFNEWFFGQSPECADLDTVVSKMIRHAVLCTAVHCLSGDNISGQYIRVIERHREAGFDTI